MMPNDQLRAEADVRRAAFFQSTSKMAKKIRPARLLDQIVGALDPDYALLNRFQIEVKRNPFALLAAVGGLWLLATQITSSRPLTKAATRQSMRPRRLLRANLKGDENDYINNA